MVLVGLLSQRFFFLIYGLQKVGVCRCVCVCVCVGLRC